MALDPITAILNIGNTLIDRLLPDRAANAAAKAQLIQMQLAGELEGMKDNLDVDKSEAASNSMFVAGWRPYIGWACGSCLVSNGIIRPFAVWVAGLLHSTAAANYPVLDMSTMLPLMMTMLGMGAMRSYDKTQGTDNGH